MRLIWPSSKAAVPTVAKPDDLQCERARRPAKRLYPPQGGTRWSTSSVARMVQIALPLAGTAEDHDGFYKAKIGTARFFFDRMLPETGARLSAILAGGKSMMEFEDAAF